MRADLEKRAELGQKIVPYRDWLPVGMILLCLIAASPTVATATVGMVLVSVTLAVLVFVEASASTFLGEDATGTIPVRGPYAVVRHPEMVAQFLVIFALAVYSGSLKVLFLGLGAYAALFYFLAAADEITLAQRLGPAYDEYAEQVPELIPNGWPRSELWELGVPWQVGVGRSLKWLTCAGIALLLMMFRS